MSLPEGGACDASPTVASRGSCTWSNLAAQERDALGSLLDRSITKLESELLLQLRTHRNGLEDMICRELGRVRSAEVLRPSDWCNLPVARRTQTTTAPAAADEGATFSGSVAWDTSARFMQQGDPPDAGVSRERSLKMDPKRTSVLARNLTHSLGTNRKGVSTGHRLGKQTMLVPHSRSFVHGPIFNLISALLIVANAGFIGYQTHVGVENAFEQANRPGEEVFDSWDTWDMVFLVFFTGELTLRAMHDRLQFIKGVEWRWNLFDSTIVGLSIVETLAAKILSGIGMNFPFLRLIRVVRVLRVLKVLHMIPFFRRLGLMLMSVAASLSALAPAFVLLILVIYMFGICLMQGIINHMDPNSGVPADTSVSVLQKRFGHINETMCTLFLSITGGISWVEVLDGLKQIGSLYTYIYMFYVGFVQICVLNIVTGVFVDTVHQMYQPEREEMVEQELKKRKVMLQNLKLLLEEADEDESGTITWDEFEAFISDEHIKMYLAAHEIDITQARGIFDHIDSQALGEVRIDEFVLGFLEMKGAAKGADLIILRNEVHKVLMKLLPFINEALRGFDDFRNVVTLMSNGSVQFTERPSRLSPTSKSTRSRRGLSLRTTPPKNGSILVGSGGSGGVGALHQEACPEPKGDVVPD